MHPAAASQCIALVCQSAHCKHLLQWCMQPLHRLTHPQTRWIYC